MLAGGPPVVDNGGGMKWEAVVADTVQDEGPLVLVAEDHPSNQKVIARQLKKLGYRSDIAEDGEVALEALGARSYAALISDIHMPKMDGLSLARAIRASESESGGHLPIIVLTADAMQIQAKQCLDAGADAVLIKPVRHEELDEVLSRCLSGELVNERPVSAVDADAGGKESAKKYDGVSGPVDPSALAEMFGADRVIIEETLEDFLVATGPMVRETRDGWEARSAERVAEAAHRVMGAARMIGARDLGEVGFEMEMAGKEERWPDMEQLLPKLESEMQRVTDYVRGDRS